MSDSTSQYPGDRQPSPSAFADAAAWVARLHGPNRTLEVENGFRRWTEMNPDHASAFEAMTAAWEATGKLPKTPFPRLSRWQRAGYREGFIRSAVAVGVVAALAVGVMLHLQGTRGVATAVGEQRVLVLDDGTRVVLNTATRVVVKYDRNIRKVVLKAGEALFEVAKRPGWPFVVEAGDRKVTALGTSFIVREDERRLSVTLVEGKVTVSPVEPDARSASSYPTSNEVGQGGISWIPSAAQSKSTSQQEAQSLTLTPGQRLTFDISELPKIDHPPLDHITAWQRGLVDFENTPLGDAVAEMNRYSVVKLVIESSQTAAIPITGVFRAGDASSFAAAVARIYRLQAMEDIHEIRLKAAEH
jgi:transmembrane sensor